MKAKMLVPIQTAGTLDELEVGDIVEIMEATNLPLHFEKQQFFAHKGYKEFLLLEGEFEVLK